MSRRLASFAIIAALSCAAMFAFPASAAAPEDEEMAARLREIQARLEAIGEEQAALDAALAEREQAVAAEPGVPPDEYLRGKVLSAEPTDEGIRYRFLLLSGAEKGREVEVMVRDYEVRGGRQKLGAGGTAVLLKSYKFGATAEYYFVDAYRVPALAVAAVLFFLLAVVFGGRRGAASVLGLAASVFIILGVLVPRIMAGADPFRVIVAGTFLIAAVTIFLAHGVNRRTSIAFSATVLTLGLAAVLAVLAVAATRLFGTGSEHALYLQLGGNGPLDLRGLLLGGILLGALGVLDDVTTAQSAVVEELKRADPTLSFSELWRRGLSVGREHIAALVNTLFLAYAGAGLPLFLLFFMYKEQPFWFILNSEIIAEEIVRTLVGSGALILAVPIATALAARYARIDGKPPCG